MTDKKSELKECETFLNQQIQINREIQLEIDEVNDKIAKLRLEKNQLSEKIAFETNESISMKRIMQSKSNELQKIRQKNRETKIDCENNRQTIEKMQNVLANLMADNQELMKKSDCAQSRLQQFNELMNGEEKLIENAQAEIERLSQMIFRSQQILQQWRDDQKTIHAEIHVLESTIKSLNSNFSIQEKKIVQQTEIHFEMVRLYCC